MGPDLWRARRRLLVRAAILAWIAIFGATHVLEVAIPDRPGKIALLLLGAVSRRGAGRSPRKARSRAVDSEYRVAEETSR